MLNPYDTAREFGHSYRRPGSSMSAITGDDFTMCDASHPNAGQDLRQAATEDADPARNRRMARGPAGAGAERRPWPRRLRAGESAGPRRVAGAARQRPDPQRLSEYHPGRPGAALPRQPGGGRAHRPHQSLERAGHGGAGQPGARRAGRPHRQLCLGRRPVRGGLQSFLSRAGSGRSRRPGLHATALRAGRLCARLPGRLPERRGPGAFPPGDHGAGARPARPVVLSAPVADAGLLAVSHRLDGNRPDQRHLSGPLHALPGTPLAGPCQ